MFNFRTDSIYSRRNSGPAESTSEHESFLYHGEFKKRPSASNNAVIPWMASTFVLGFCLLVVLYVDYPLLRRESYESGYSTEMRELGLLTAVINSLTSTDRGGRE